MLRNEKIFYWQGVIGGEEALSTYDVAINKILNGEYGAADLDAKKVPGHDLFSIRVNDADRLLFTTIHVNGKRCLLLLEVVLNHDYGKSRFLKSKVLKHYLEKNRHVLNAPFSAQEVHALFTKHKNTRLRYTPIQFYQQKFIELNDRQQAAQLTPKPLVLSGAPGSGKTCVAALLIQETVRAWPADQPCRIVYVTQSVQLVRMMREECNAVTLSAQREDMMVSFMTPTQLTEVHGDSDKTLVDKAHCLAWFARYHKKYAQIHTQEKTSLNALAETDKVYQECRIISGYQPEDYLALGERQSLFTDPTHRAWLLKAFADYNAELERNKQMHPPFYSLPTKAEYDVVIVDEAQDLSLLQLNVLHALAKKSQIVYCMGGHQNLNDVHPNLLYTLTMLNKEASQKATHIELIDCYRCPTHIINAANTIITLKHLVTGGRENKYAPAQIQPPEEVQAGKHGIVQHLEHWDDETLTDLKERAKQPDVAIVTWAEHKEEAQLLFGTVLVFTAEEIKGLEYQTVVAYRLFDNKLMQDANEKLGNVDIDCTKPNVHRAKKTSSEERFGPLFNHIFTAFTRATRCLIIYQPPHRKIENISRYLRNHIIKQSGRLAQENKIDVASHASAWVQEAKRLEDNGFTTQANHIYNQFRREPTQEKNNTLPIRKKKSNQLKKNKKKQPSITPMPSSPLLAEHLESQLLDAVKKNDVEAIHAMCDAGANPNICVKAYPPLTMATILNYPDVVLALLDKGANIDLSHADSGITPLNAATICGHIGMVSLLLQKGAEIGMRQQIKVLHLLIIATAHDRSHNINKFIRLYTNNEVTPETIIKNINSLHFAILFDQIDILKLFLEKMSGLTYETLQYFTELAKKFKCHEIITLLQSRMPTIEIKSPMPFINNEKEIKYINDLFASLSEGSLINLFKHEKMEKFLFGYTAHNNKNIFIMIATHHEKLMIMDSFFKKNVPLVAAKINGRLLYWLSVLTYSEMRDSARVFSLTYLTMLAENILPRELYTIYEDNNSAFFYLTQSEKGQVFFTHLLVHNPYFVAKITEKILCAAIKMKLNGMQGLYPLYNLSITSTGRDILKYIFLHSPKLKFAQNMSLAAWKQEVELSSGKKSSALLEIANHLDEFESLLPTITALLANKKEKNSVSRVGLFRQSHALPEPNTGGKNKLSQ